MKREKIDTKYKKEITFKFILTSACRRWKMVIFFLLFFVGLGAVANTLMSPPVYQAYGCFTTTQHLVSPVIIAMKDMANSELVFDSTVEDLKEKGITTSTGKEIDKMFLRQHIQVEEVVNFYTVDVFCRGSADEKTILVPIVNTLLENAVEIGNSDYDVFNSGLTLSKVADNYTQIDQGQKIKYLAFTLVGLLVGVINATVNEKIGGYLYNNNEILEYGIPSLEFNPQKSRKLFLKKSENNEDSDETLESRMVELQNNLCIYSQTHTSNILAITTTRRDNMKEYVDFVKLFVDTYAKNGEKTLVIDFDLLDCFKGKHLTQYKYNAETDEEGNVLYKAPQNVDLLEFKKGPYGIQKLLPEVLKERLEKYAQEYSKIIFVTSPIIESHSLLALNELVDDTIVFCKKGCTRHTDLLESYRLLESFDSVVSVFKN